MNIHLVEVTPSKARKLLESNPTNRKLSQSLVNHLSQQIKQDEWKLTGDTIKIGTDGFLKDGQHRLSAIIQANKAVKLYLCDGVDPDAFSVIDTGKKRSAGDVLYIAGYSNVNQLSGIVRGLIAFDSSNFNGDLRVGRQITNTKILKYVEKHHDALMDTLHYAQSVTRRFKGLSTIFVAILYHLFLKINNEQAFQFFEKYAEGANLGSQNPIHLLRSRFIQDQVNKSKLSTRDKMALMINAWNLFIKGDNTKSLALKNGYKFPTI